MTTVNIDWDALNRDNPITVKVTDQRTATAEYKRTSTTVTGNDEDDRDFQLRRQLAKWTQAASRDALPVIIYDASDEDPFMELLVITANGDLISETPGAGEDQTHEVPENYRKNAITDFKTWKTELTRTRSRRAAQSVAIQEPTLPPAPKPGDAQEQTAAAEPEPDHEGEAEPETLGVFDTIEPEEQDPEPESEEEHSPRKGSFNFFANESRRDIQVKEAPPAQAAPPVGRFEMESLMLRGKHSRDAALGWRGTMNRTLGTHLPPDAYEEQIRKDLGVITSGWYDNKIVSVINDKGGASKTPTAIGLSAAFARNISLLVALVDNNENAGNAIDRVEVEGTHQRTTMDLARRALDTTPMALSEMDSYVHRHAEDRYHLLASYHPPLDTPGMNRTEMNNIYELLSRFYSLTINDSGNAMGAPNWWAMIQNTDQIVVPVMTAPDRDNRARLMLEKLDERGGHYADLAANAVVAVSVWNPNDKKFAEELVERWTPHVREVVVIPHDRNIGSHNLRWDSLQRNTQGQFLALAAAVTRGLQA